MPSGVEEVFSNPLAPPGESHVEESKPQRLTNADFRKLIMTPRAPSTTTKETGSSTTTSATVQPQIATKSTEVKEDVKATERKKKKSYYAKIKKEEEEKMAELAEKYRDRARERREGKNPDYQAEDPSQAGMGAYRAVAPDLKSGIDAAERRKQLIQDSKFLGGDMEHTHLVKGLDYALLQKVRSEITLKEQESEVEIQEETDLSVSNKEKKSSQAMPPPLPPSTAPLQEEDNLAFKTSFGRRVFNSVFNSKPPEFNDLFLPSRMAYAIDLEDETEGDIPTTVIRSKADLVGIENVQATFTTNDIVIQKLTQILSYLRTGRAGKKQKKREKGKEVGAGRGADDSIYGDIGDYVPNMNKTDKERDRGRDKDRRDRGGDRKRSYFNRPTHEEVQAELQVSEHNLAPQWPSAEGGVAAIDKSLAGVVHTETNQMGQPLSGPDKANKSKFSSNDFYTECYPGMDAMQDAIDDSDDEADYTKMDLGNKKGPVGRWDFDTQEEYSDYMNQREAMPKAAFQYGVKMADGRKTRRIAGNREKDKNAELKSNREWQQIQQILKRRKDSDYPSDKRSRYNY